MKSLAVCCLLVLLALPATALESYLVEDINPGPPGSDPRHLVRFDDVVLFFASGILWRSDGTAGGTFPLADEQLPDPRPFLVTEDLYFFLDAHPALASAGLWVSDGTEAGTFRLTAPGVAIVWLLEQRGAWVDSQGVLYFTARDPEHGAELWRTDGTPAGTRLVSDIRPGPEGSNAERLAAYKGQVWFFADDGQHDNALWRSDGTPAGTVLAIDLPPLAPLTDLEPIWAVGDRLAFMAPAPNGGLELWAGDGTVQGTRPIKAFTALFDSMVRGNRLYLAAETKKGHEVWVSDGTARGTRALTNFQKPDAFSGIGIVFEPQEVNGRFLFRADDGAHGAEFWVTDGTRQGTRLLKDFCPGGCPGYGLVLDSLGGRLYFTATNPARGHELWSTDGRSARFVADICPGSCSSGPYSSFVLGGRLFFVARDGEHGEEVWSTNGRAAGTVRVTDFAPPFLWEEDGFHGAVVNGKLLFGADDGVHGMELWAIEP